MATTVREALEAGAAGDAAIEAPGQSALTFAELRATVDRLAGQLRALGVARDERVAVVLPNGPEAAIAFLAASTAAAAAPLSAAYTEPEFRFYLEDCRARALLTFAGDAEAAHAALPEGGLHLALGGAGAELTITHEGAPVAPVACDPPAPEDVALVLHTSGTTSRPKLVPLTHANLAASAGNIGASLRLTAADRCLNVMPLFHIHGLVAAVLSSLAAGGSVVCTPGFDGFRFFRWLEDHEPSWYTAVPTMHQLVVQRAARHAEVIARRPLRFMRSSSAALPPSVMRELEEVFGAPLVEAYGMTEAAHQMAANPLPPGERKPGSVGRGTGVEVAILEDGGRELAAGETGEVAIRGPNVTSGYEGNPQANTEAFTGGWFRTGDQGYLDGDGYLFLTGRLKEIINRGGEKISPREIDEVLLEHPAIEQCVAFAVPHPRLGEEVGVAVVLAEGAALSERDLREHAAARLADFKVPRRVVFVDEIPKGPTGKLQRIGLAQQLGLGSEGG